uniref:BZIP domain-containing protein n=1 Tax=Elaeophora elaphi TaxID=1147741 RepID=A0A0R3RJB1_9BILA
MEKEVEVIRVLESNNSVESVGELAVPTKQGNGKLRSSWVESVESIGSHTVQEMNPIATHGSKSTTIILHNEFSDDNSNINQIRSTKISPRESAVSEITITSSVPNKQAIRERIRQKVMQEIEAKRGTAQLSKRLQRRQRSDKLTKQDSFETLVEMNQEELDRQIEHSMMLGEKCTADCVHYLPPDDIQYEFMTGQFHSNQEVGIKQKQSSKGLKNS